jgi:hypothetical protein
MKRFKIGFLALIGIIAMSFTVANKVGTTTKKSVILTDRYTCSSNDIRSFSYKNSLGTCVSITNSGSDCNILSPETCVFDIQTVGATTTNCDGGTKFCCADVDEDADCEQTCSGVTKFGKELLQIY